MTEDSVLFFATAKDFRTWLDKNHASLDAQWIGYYKKHTKTPSMTWSESVDHALCYGWIDGLRKSIDDKSYKIRFTPRNVKSHWSAVNLQKMEELIQQGLMMPSGLAIYQQRNPKNAMLAAHEQKNVVLDTAYELQLKDNPAAWDFFEQLSASVKRQSIHWVMSAKQESTRQKRLAILIESCANGVKIPTITKYA